MFFNAQWYIIASDIALILLLLMNAYINHAYVVRAYRELSRSIHTLRYDKLFLLFIIGLLIAALCVLLLTIAAGCGQFRFRTWPGRPISLAKRSRNNAQWRPEQQKNGGEARRFTSHKQ